MTRQLEGQVAIVTGGARGIGRAIAQRFADAGATVCIADRDGDGAQRAARALGGDGTTALGLAVDIAHRGQVDELMDTVDSHFGRVDILVNNAAHARYGFAIDLGDDDWDYTLGVSLTGTFTCAQRAARRMIETGGGRIVNITSMAAHVGLARTVAYAACKGAVEAMTRVMAIELAEYGVRVNAIAPGPVDTEFSREVVSDAGRAERLRRLPSGRFGAPEDVAAAALFLASADAAWVTGATLIVDGGFTIAGAIESRRAAGAVAR
jgi:NAD(P)-dependent dehydrogenase (short-subunit alcohol dehydrogenase family)